MPPADGPVVVAGGGPMPPAMAEGFVNNEVAGPLLVGFGAFSLTLLLQWAFQPSGWGARRHWSPPSDPGVLAIVEDVQPIKLYNDCSAPDESPAKSVQMLLEEYQLQHMASPVSSAAPAASSGAPSPGLALLSPLEWLEAWSAPLFGDLVIQHDGVQKLINMVNVDYLGSCLRQCFTALRESAWYVMTAMLAFAQRCRVQDWVSLAAGIFCVFWILPLAIRTVRFVSSVYGKGIEVWSVLRGIFLDGSTSPDGILVAVERVVKMLNLSPAFLTALSDALDRALARSGAIASVVDRETKSMAAKVDSNQGDLVKLQRENQSLRDRLAAKNTKASHDYNALKAELQALKDENSKVAASLAEALSSSASSASSASAAKDAAVSAAAAAAKSASSPPPSSTSTPLSEADIAPLRASIEELKTCEVFAGAALREARETLESEISALSTSLSTWTAIVDPVLAERIDENILQLVKAAMGIEVVVTTPSQPAAVQEQPASEDTAARDALSRRIRQISLDSWRCEQRFQTLSPDASFDETVVARLEATCNMVNELHRQLRGGSVVPMGGYGRGYMGR